MKKIISIVLAIALIMTSLTFGEVSAIAEEESWKSGAITAPAEGKLVGAGYIDITYKTDLDGATEYHVYFDGKPVEELEKYKYTVVDENNAKCEVYTTQVSAHTAKVVATTADGTVESDTITFYVSKKGIAMGSDMSQVVDLSKLNLSWYYDWDTTPLESGIGDGIELAPMVWGKGNVKDADGNIVTEGGVPIKTTMEEYIPELEEDLAKIDSSAKYILGYNEPDIPSQANMTVEEALTLWPKLQIEGKRLVAPAPADPNGTSKWLEEFMAGIDADAELYCDAVALHWYQSYPSANSILNIIDSLYEKYQRPIWFTEISVVGYNKEYTDYSYENEASREKVKNFLKELIPELDKREYVERYAWFPYNVNSENKIDAAKYSGASAMFDYDTGKFTELGRLYSEMGNPEGYNGYTMNKDDEYVHIEPTTVPVTTKPVIVPTTKQNETVNQTTKAKVTEKQPVRVTIKKAKNIKKRSINITWKKATNAKKYQIQYSTNKKFKKATKTKVTSKLKITIKGLKKKKTYYVRVRGVNGKAYGKWSKVKKVKIKK